MDQKPKRFPRSLRDIARTIIRPCFKKQGFLNGSIIEDWEMIIGPEYKDQIVPEKITFPKNKNNSGTLHVLVSSGGASLLIEHNKNQILNRINTYYGYQALSNLQMKVSYSQTSLVKPSKKKETLTPEESDKIQALTKEINDNELKAILEQLGCAMILDKKENDKGMKES
jgi:hypothetical protein